MIDGISELYDSLSLAVAGFPTSDSMWHFRHGPRFCTVERYALHISD
jgi:hypothetical protein